MSRPCGIVCVGCGGRNLRVLATRALDNTVYRRRMCKDCGAKFSTIEEIVPDTGRGKGGMESLAMRDRNEMRRRVEAFITAFQDLAAIGPSMTSTHGTPPHDHDGGRG